MKQKILYIHGLSSSGSSSTAKNLRMFCPNYEILSPDLPILPDEALDMLRSLCKKEHPNIIIGTSMGGLPDSSEVIAKYWSTRLFTFPNSCAPRLVFMNF